VTYRFATAIVALVIGETLACAGPAPQSESTDLPRLVRFGGAVKDAGGKLPSGEVALTFTFYRDPQGGASLWSETQSVRLNSQGRYSVLLGSTHSGGLPQELFSGNQARWIGVQPELPGVAEQPRALLAGVPYAMKAGDAETLGGIPASAYVTTDLLNAVLPQPAVAAAGEGSGFQTESAQPAAGTGTKGFIPMWTGAKVQADSTLFQSGSGAAAEVGIGTTTPASTLDVNGAATVRGVLNLPATGAATAAGGTASDPLTFTASAFNGTAGAAQNQAFTWQAQPVANNTGAPSGSLNLLFGANGGSASQTGLSIGANGLIGFAPGQPFPGTGPGTITGVAAGTGLKGGGATGNVTLNLDTTVVPQLNAANSFTGSQSINGALTATGALTAASLTTPLIDGVGAFFTGNIAMLISTSEYAGILSMGPYPFLHCYGGATNTFVGSLANGMLPPGPPFATNNTGIGFETLYLSGAGSQPAAASQAAGRRRRHNARICGGAAVVYRAEKNS
jgi:hypothetical protein